MESKYKRTVEKLSKDRAASKSRIEEMRWYSEKKKCKENRENTWLKVLLQ